MCGVEGENAVKISRYDGRRILDENLCRLVAPTSTTALCYLFKCSVKHRFEFFSEILMSLMESILERSIQFPVSSSGSHICAAFNGVIFSFYTAYISILFAIL